jgi:hypothetical protein
VSSLVIYTPIPLVLGKSDDRHGMRGVLEDVVIPRLFSCYHVLCLTADVYHGIAKPFECWTWARGDGKHGNSPHRSISSRDSDSVGSISIHVEIGHETVGG